MNDLREPGHPEEPGIFFNLDELKILFSGLKTHEEDLAGDAKTMLNKIEKVLYNYLSIREFELLSCFEGNEAECT